MKLWLCDNGETKYLVRADHTPPHAVAEAPEGEKPEHMIVTDTVVEGVPTKSISIDSAKKSADESADSKKIQVKSAYDTMISEVYSQMATVFETQKTDAATANYETWKHMKDNPASYSSLGLKVKQQIMNADNTELFDEGAALDTDQKIVDFSTRKIELAHEYGVWRMQRKKQFEDEKQTIENS